MKRVEASEVPDWRILLDEHGPAVWRTVYRLLNHHADASDCFQETFLSYVKLSRQQAIANPGAMFRTLATARAMDRIRARSRDRRQRETDDALDQAISALPGPSQQAEAVELTEQLRRALARLPDAQAQAYCLRFFEELSYEEIAAAMNLTTQAAGVLLHRARKQLQESFKEYA